MAFFNTSVIKNYGFTALLLAAIFAGFFTGYAFKEQAIKLKPLGDIFIDVMFILVMPLLAFSIASAIASMRDGKKFWKIMFAMMIIFLFTSSIAAIFMIVVVTLFPPTAPTTLSLLLSQKIETTHVESSLTNTFSGMHFLNLFSRGNILILILFSIFIGLVTRLYDQKQYFSRFLHSGTAILMKIVSLVMYYAPIGFFAYFAVLGSEIGTTLLHTYSQIISIYFLAAIIYFIGLFSFYAYLAGKKAGVFLFWQHVSLPALTAFATCSGAASIPINLQATKKMGVPEHIYELVIPLGTMIHKDGSVLGGIIKISFLFSLFHMNFSSPSVLFIAIIVALLVGTVMGAIPSGGMIGEIFILSAYGFPPQALIVIAAISIIIDAPATMLNVVGNSVSSMMVARLTYGSNWLKSIY